VRHEPVEHGIKSSNFINPHRRHFEEFGHIVHNAYTSPSLVLTLAQIKQGNDGRFFVLSRIVPYDLLCSSEVLWGEFECDIRVVVCGIPVLFGSDLRFEDARLWMNVRRIKHRIVSEVSTRMSG
jgi:hypothetical protein